MAGGSTTLVSTTGTKRNRRFQKGSKKLATMGSVKRMINRLTDHNAVNGTTAGGAIIQAGTVYSVSNGATAPFRFISYELGFSVLNVTNANNTVRFILFQWRESSVPTTDDVLNTTILEDVDVNVAHYAKNVHIIKDVNLSMNLFDKSQKFYHWRIRSKKLKPYVIDNDGVVNKLYLLAISSDVDTNTTLSTMYFKHITHTN